jgi:type III pantothenate kinase
VSRATLDVGNSSIGIAPWSDSGPGPVERFGQPEEAAARLLALGPACCAAIAVAPRRLDALLLHLGARAGAVRILSRPPETLGAPSLLASAGADRIANVLGVGAGPAVIVDAGTAVTVDLLATHGAYLGGYIAPGPAAALAGLVGATECLPDVPCGSTALGPGADTEAAMQAGVWGLVVGGVDRLVDEASRAVGSPARIVATGGWGAAWAKDSRHVHVSWAPDLVHRGIARWAGWS